MDLRLMGLCAMKAWLSQWLSSAMLRALSSEDKLLERGPCSIGICIPFVLEASYSGCSRSAKWCWEKLAEQGRVWWVLLVQVAKEATVGWLGDALENQLAEAIEDRDSGIMLETKEQNTLGS